jgi:hypothetical protein
VNKHLEELEENQKTMVSWQPVVNLEQFKKIYRGGAWWCMSVIPALGRLKLEYCKFEDSLGYIDSVSKKV